MSSPLLDHLAHGTFNFLRGKPIEIRQIVPSIEERLPAPEPIFLEDETATPLLGFPILVSRALHALEGTLSEYLRIEEEIQLYAHTRESFDTRAYTAKWERYRSVLAAILKNAIGSSFGARFADIFWIHHSHFVATYLRGIPKRMLQADLTVGRDFGDEIKYRVFDKWASRVVDATYDVVQEMARELGDDEATLFPPVLTMMRDNVLILTEEHISPDLSELSSYFNGCLKTDGRDFRSRLAAVKEWHDGHLESDEVLRSAATHLAGADAGTPTSRLINHPGYLSFLASHISYSTSHFLTAEQIRIWESLLLKLKEFELLQALRKMVVPIETIDGAWVSSDRSTNMTWVGGPPVLRLSPATRPIDFSSSWVVDPLVQRFGLVYDISDFSATISMLGRQEKAALERAFETTFHLQRKINQLAHRAHLRLEKYLGDGAFYSGRHARNLIGVAIRIQRLYKEACDRGFPFNKGLRIAVNFGEYRLLPLEGGASDTTRYEFFGHGLVELARLTTGKKTEEIEELKNYLVGQGYPEATVARFFEPMARKSADLVNKSEESRTFFAYINPNGTLINEGIVATEPFLKRLGQLDQLYYGKDDSRRYIVAAFPEDGGDSLLVGLRKLGLGKFKGLEQMPIYELIDGRHWSEDSLQKIPSRNLLGALEKVYAARKSRVGKTTTRSRPAVAKS